jgi:hypothetical protein
MIGKLLGLVILSTLCSLASAEDNAPKMNEVEALRQQGYSVRTIIPIFSQLVTFSFPKDFVPAFENAKGGQYIQESVLEGESVQKWSQMITITGAKGLAANPNVTPARFAGSMAGGFKRVCPDSYSATYSTAGFGEIKFGIHDAFAVVISCGTAGAMANPYSESMLLIVIKGESDYYTIQWSERGDASKTPIKFDSIKWPDRLKKLTPIKLCPIVPGEQAPYPSCANSA